MRKTMSWLLLITLVVMAIPAFVPQPVAAMSGAGTAEDPYMIYDVTDLQNMKDDLTAYYELANDIDASGTQFWNWNGSYYEGVVPIGTEDSRFLGSLDGNENAITGLYFAQNLYHQGLFGVIGDGASISNLHLINFSLSHTGTLGRLGTLAGEIDKATVKNVHVKGSSLTGGVAPSDKKDACPVGGMAALISYSSFADCTVSTSTITVASHYAGGFVAKVVLNATFLRSFAEDVDIVSTMNKGHYYGGFTGWAFSNADFNQCFATGTIHAPASPWFIGGFVGSSDQPSKYTDCYARVDITTTGDYANTVGGFVGMSGHSNNKYVRTYSTGHANVVGKPPWGGRIGGWCGYRQYAPVITACFWDTQTSGMITSDGGIGKTTAQMKTQSTFTDAGWDFDNVWQIEGVVNDGYPFLQWWYDPASWIIKDIYKVLEYQPNQIIQGTTLPDRQGNQDGIITWGANPAGINITHTGFTLDDSYYDYMFEPFVPGGADIIKPEPASLTGDVDLDRLKNNPLYPLMLGMYQTTGIPMRLLWLGLAILVLIAVMVFVLLTTGHIMFCSAAGLGVSVMFYVMGVFPFWVVILLIFGLIASIIYERMPTL